MGLFDMFKDGQPDVRMTRRALDEASAADGDDSAVTRLIQQILALGVRGTGPYDSASTVADKALARSTDAEEAVDRVVSQHLIGGTAAGFVTGVGGFITMLVALPANVFAFYVHATRMVAAIAHLRGYDLDRAEIRTAVLLTLIGSNSADVLAKAGVPVTAGVLATATRSLPRSAVMIVQKAVGFRILRQIGQQGLSRLGRFVPVAGGVIGAGFDHAMMRRIAVQAREEFPPVA